MRMEETFAPIIVEDEPKKPWWKRIWVWVVAAILVVIVIGVVSSGKSEDSGMVTIEVERNDLIQTVEASGELESAEDLSLALEASGIVDHLFVQVGDFVDAGELLLTLQGGTRLSQVSAARRALNASQARLRQFVAGASEEDIKIQEAAVTVAETRLATAELDLQQTTDQYDLDVSDASRVLIQSIQSGMIEVRDALTEADQILGIENTLANDAFESQLAVNDHQTLIDAKASYEKAMELRDRYELDSFNLSEDDAIGFVVNVEETLMETENTLRNTRRALDATRSNTAALPLSDVATYQASINAARDALQLKRESLQLKKQSLEELLVSEAVAVVSETVLLRRAELIQAQASLDSDVRDQRPIDVAVYEADVQKAFADLDAAQSQFDQLELRAPIEGTVTDLLVDLGEPVSALTGVVELQSFGNLFTVNTLISESDIINVSLGQIATITFDAFGEDVEFVGRVVHIDPAEEEVEGVVFFETEVVLTDVYREGLRPGLSADVTIETLRINDAITVPQRATKREGENVSVRVLVDEEIQERDVTLGKRGDGGRIEILSGLNEGDIVIISIEE